VAYSIAKAVVIKQGNVFFLSQPEGDVPLTREHGFGLYYHDCRYLNGYELMVGDEHPEPLAARSSEGARAVFQLTTPEFQSLDGRTIDRETVGLKWERLIDAESRIMHERLDIQNFGFEPVEFMLRMRFRAEFEDVFAIRGILRESGGKRWRPRWIDKRLVFSYSGGDGVFRSLAIHFDPLPAAVKGAGVEFRLAFKPGETRQLRIALAIDEVERPVKRAAAHVRTSLDLPAGRASRDEWTKPETEFDCDSLLLTRVMRRSLMDLQMLKTSLGGDEFFAAGIPWFATLFGRDSLIASLQALAFWPETPAHTLRLLARYQGTEVNEWRDEQPGKILHELRVGELARMNKIPHTPYYGTIDATPLFLILLSQHAQWTGDLALFQELRPSVDRALDWIDRYGNEAGDGYVSYSGNTKEGLLNQGWKDSGDAVMTSDGRLAHPPIALAEVQGYVYLAKMSIAELFERAGEPRQAARLREEAEGLRLRFNRDFWMEDEGCYAMALETGHRPCRVISSNAGQALWAGIADEHQAGRVVKRLMQPDMFNGWGIRTLSLQERRYNPMGYHLGTVWPHDNSMIAAGFRRYGFDEEARRVFVGLLDAAIEFEDHRLPELFTGFGRSEYGVPVRYPVACHPQAWAAAAVPYLVQVSLGLTPKAFEKRLEIVRPCLPDFVRRAEIRRLRVGKGSVDLRFERNRDGFLETHVSRVAGDLSVDILTSPA